METKTTTNLAAKRKAVTNLAAKRKTATSLAAKKETSLAAKRKTGMMAVVGAMIKRMKPEKKLGAMMKPKTRSIATDFASKDLVRAQTPKP